MFSDLKQKSNIARGRRRWFSFHVRVDLELLKIVYFPARMVNHGFLFNAYNIHLLDINGHTPPYHTRGYKGTTLPICFIFLLCINVCLVRFGFPSHTISTYWIWWCPLQYALEPSCAMYIMSRWAMFRYRYIMTSGHAGGHYTVLLRLCYVKPTLETTTAAQQHSSQFP